MKRKTNECVVWGRGPGVSGQFGCSTQSCAPASSGPLQSRRHSLPNVLTHSITTKGPVLALKHWQLRPEAQLSLLSFRLWPSLSSKYEHTLHLRRDHDIQSLLSPRKICPDHPLFPPANRPSNNKGQHQALTQRQSETKHTTIEVQ